MTPDRPRPTFPAVSGLTIANKQHGPQRFIYAATHGRGAYRLTLN